MGSFGSGEDFGRERAEVGACCKRDAFGACFGKGESRGAPDALGGTRYENVVSCMIGFGGGVDGGVGIGMGGTEGFP